MKYLKISNKGLIEEGALTLLGASTKRGDSSKIGMFGSGNKYAIACLMRNNRGFKIFTGKKEIGITTTKKVFANRDFRVVCVNGTETSITTETGHKWKLWQAIREVYCNAVDEGDYKLEIVEEIEPALDRTEFYIELKDDILDIYENLKDYFTIGKTVLYEDRNGQILEKHGPDTCIYRKGIKVYETERRSIYDYNLFDVDISEDRTSQYPFQIYSSIHKMIMNCDNKIIIRKYLATSKHGDYLEGNFKSSLDNYISISKQFKEVVGNMVVFDVSFGGYLSDSEKKDVVLLESELYKSLIKHCPEDINTPRSIKNIGEQGCNYKDCEPEPLREQMLKEVLKFFKECKFKINYNIQIVEFFSNEIHGAIKKESKTILLSKKAFEEGKHWVASTIIEEQCHLDSESADETRKMQNSLINVLLGYMKERNTITL